MPKSICLFNHKGGVSKTTTTFNLGWGLANQGKKVLIVDLDSQCNLTGLVLGYNAIDDENMESFYASRQNLTMKPIVAALINGVSLKIASGIPATRNIPGNLPKLLDEVSKKTGVDYVIFDLSPNVGGLNEVILMSCDYFIVPTSPDYFCLQAINSLGKNIIKWHREISRFKEDNGFDNLSFPIKNSPQFIEAIQQRYRPRNERPAKSFQNWIDIIRDSINSRLVPSLTKIGCAKDYKSIELALSGTGLKPYDLAHIPDFNSLIAISQQLSKPVFALTDDEIKQIGKVFGHAEKTMQDSRDNFSTIFKELAQRVVMLTS